MLYQTKYESRDEEVDQIVRKVLSKRQLTSFSPEKTKPLHPQYKQTKQLLGFKSITQQRDKSSNYTTIPNENIHNYQLQLQNQQLQNKLNQLRSALNKKQNQQRKCKSKQTQIKHLQAKLKQMFEANQSIQEQLSSLRLSRYKSNSMVSHHNLSKRSTKKHPLNETQCCCQKQKKCRAVMKSIKLQESRRAILTDSREAKTQRPKQNLHPNVTDSRLLRSSLKDSNVQCNFQLSEESKEVYALKNQEIQNQKIYIESLMKVIHQQEKVLKDYQKQLEQVPQMNKFSQAGKFMKVSKSKSDLKKTITHSDNKKLANIGSTTSLIQKTQKMKNSLSIGSIVKTNKKG